ncbi:predicted protein [Aspergillus nidulans FGSC A4]|uniref:Uncharacterized protein n=1 Tax=Emericella nidulans (strain FGSC A4 / ATCC 38163 / CBS 112.46 / NRRL 194 / M139) TaxID=227321 RepID=Q5BA92_EMENI|nr:hypothetical protein [Aspergillus nidulans FGSC A4]EAA64643.1 predicted protein [Aspergillus nidulans FGSC A4]CBF87054.1 TPA: hypothetical protein ANIA_02538 [Aspergillus nidulans FGSC A4]|eukprot:XP_660142.1 predicted protein [Aspergillus nidulans FGSC A4]
MSSFSLDDYLDDLSDYGFDYSDFGLDDEDFDYSDYLNDDDFDYSDYGLDDEDFDFDYSDYLPSSTSSASYPTSTSYDWLSGGDSGDDGDITTPSSSDYDMNLDGTPPNGEGSTNGLPSSLGGAFGSDFSNQQVSDSCVSEVAFKTTAPKVDLAFDVIFLVLFIALAVFTVIRLFKIKRNGGGMVNWVLFPISLFFTILYLFLDTITLILSECVMMRGDKYWDAQTAVQWFSRLAIFLLIVIIMLPICRKLQQGGGIFATLTLVLHSLWIALTGIFLIVSLALTTRVRVGDRDGFKLEKASNGVTMAYSVFLFIAALLALVNMGIALVKKANLRKGLTLITIPVLALSTLILTLILMGGFADNVYGSKNRSAKYFQQSGDAQTFLARLFYAVSFVSALFVAGANTANDDAAQSAPSMTQTPKPAEYYQPQPQPVTTAPVPAPAQH